MYLLEANERVDRDVRVDYFPEPTISRFHHSNAFLRGIRGSVGSGKTAGCINELFMRMNEQEPDRHGVRRSRWACIRNCYDDETEILTEDRGFQLFRDLLPEDRLATLQEGIVKYEPHEGISAHDYEGEMLGFESEGANFLVTPDHKMWVSRKTTRKQAWGEYEQKEAHTIYGTSKYRVRRDGEWVGDPTDKSAAFFEWLGYWYAEGSWRREKGRNVAIVTTVTGIEYTRDLFWRAGIGYTENRRADAGINFRVKVDDDLFSYLCPGKAATKVVSPRVRMAPAGHIAAFLEGYMQGDGHRRKDASTVTLYTSSRRLADDLQELAMKSGVCANVSYRDRRGGMVFDGAGRVNNVEYIITLLGKGKCNPNLYVNPRNTNHLRGWYKKPYKGKVYCAIMPIPTVYVRRRGKSFWCQRTYPELKTTTVAEFQEWFPEQIARVTFGAPITAIVKYRNLNDGTVVHAEVYFVALDRPVSVRKLKGLQLTGAFVNEASEIRWSIIAMLIGRIGRYPSEKQGARLTWSGIWMDTNSMSDDHWWYKASEGDLEIGPDEEQVDIPDDEEWEFFTQPPALLKVGSRYKPNPLAENVKHQPLGYKYWLRMLRNGEDWVRVFVLNEYGSIYDGKPVYADFSEHLHISKVKMVAVKDYPLVLGWDFGLTPACIIGQMMPWGQLRILEEICADQIGLESFVKHAVLPILRTRYSGMEFESVADPSGVKRDDTDLKTCLKVLRGAGIKTEAALSNKTQVRWDAVIYFLTMIVRGRPGIIINAACRRLRKGFNGAYRIKRLQVISSGEDQDRYHTGAEKNLYSHPHDGLQYLCLHVRGSDEIASKKIPDPQVRAHRVIDRKAGY